MHSLPRIFYYLLPLTGLMLFCIVSADDSSHDPNSLEALIEAGGKYIGTKVCQACHPSQHSQLSLESHGQMSDERTPFAGKGCETCHGPGEEHAKIRSGPQILDRAISVFCPSLANA